MFTKTLKYSLLVVILILSGSGCIGKRAHSNNGNGNTGGVVIVPPPEREPGIPDDFFKIKVVKNSELDKDLGIVGSSSEKTRLNLYEVRPNTYVNKDEELFFYFSDKDDFEGEIARAHYLVGATLIFGNLDMYVSPAYFSTNYQSDLVGKQGCFALYSGTEKLPTNQIEPQSRLEMYVDGGDGKPIKEYCAPFGNGPKTKTVYFNLSYTYFQTMKDMTLIQYVGDSIATAKSYFPLPNINSKI